jgi:glycosyl-4,4'-diaponeurosporenoate acyltransferase
VVVDVAAWALLSTLVGYLGHRRPVARFDHDTVLSRIRPFERDGRLYERLGVRRWKDHLPEAGALFRGGVSKAALPGRSPAALARLATETRRAEWVHRALLAASLLFLLWNPPLLALAMVLYAVVANVPCLMVQRYNRARLLRLLALRPHS